MPDSNQIRTQHEEEAVSEGSGGSALIEGIIAQHQLGKLVVRQLGPVLFKVVRPKAGRHTLNHCSH